MSFACIYGGECNGCMACEEPQADPQEDYNRRIDAAYDKARDE